ncbi:DUF3303 domain-containing protein [Geodermatophilus ruber]|uniref:DUF3303 domain-containing protein n=1 Tax=Geodermatophilus ruber TaxID=504800 RepID=A0A1I4H6X3_9ACTN|nr:DUF3303 family protein [Geodermatophilus ruber]SFL37156.1 hypothetical protein SAMN04488085_11033 [Geodermatophilus ruber]
MGQMYLHRFAYRDGVAKAEIDAAWAEAMRTFAKSGNWGGVERGITHHKTYGTSWGGYVLFEADDPEALARYQAYQLQHYAHAVEITIEPLYDMDSALADAIGSWR